MPVFGPIATEPVGSSATIKGELHPINSTKAPDQIITVGATYSNPVGGFSAPFVDRAVTPVGVTFIADYYLRPLGYGYISGNDGTDWTDGATPVNYSVGYRQWAVNIIESDPFPSTPNMSRIEYKFTDVYDGPIGVGDTAQTTTFGPMVTSGNVDAKFTPSYVAGTSNLMMGLTEASWQTGQPGWQNTIINCLLFSTTGLSSQYGFTLDFPNQWRGENNSAEGVMRLVGSNYLLFTSMWDDSSLTTYQRWLYTITPSSPSSPPSSSEPYYVRRKIQLSNPADDAIFNNTTDVWSVNGQTRPSYDAFSGFAVTQCPAGYIVTVDINIAGVRTRKFWQFSPDWTQYSEIVISGGDATAVSALDLTAPDVLYATQDDEGKMVVLQDASPPSQVLGQVGTVTVSEQSTYVSMVYKDGVVVTETSSGVTMTQPGLIVSETSAYIVYIPVTSLVATISASIIFSVAPNGAYGLPNIFVTKPVVDEVDIILRRGPSYDLPGHPYTTSPTVWAPGLDEAELAFSIDQSRIFLGSDPTRNLPQATRKSYPYQNIEVLGELSTDAFAKMHGNFIKAQGNSAYYHAALAPTNSPQNVIVDGSPFAFATGGELFSASVNYVVYCNGDMVRNGDLDITYGDATLVPDVIDCYDMLRTEFFNPFAFNFTVGSNLPTRQFSLSVAVINGVATLRYTSAIPGSVTIRFNSSVPFATLPKFGLYDKITEQDDTVSSTAKLHIKANATQLEQDDTLGPIDTYLTLTVKAVNVNTAGAITSFGSGPILHPLTTGPTGGAVYPWAPGDMTHNLIGPADPIPGAQLVDGKVAVLSTVADNGWTQIFQFKFPFTDLSLWLGGVSMSLNWGAYTDSSNLLSNSLLRITYEWWDGESGAMADIPINFLDGSVTSSAPFTIPLITR